ncbi:hypothetical protein MAPG_01872 [Magnaporthiopsis poae ATCC 64411]|uniref:Peptidase A1 domain-containing protein n=1 Tax=Magnaporthiopsis poae (strain ATCC 64411 / 73-15) TaxID=644358 RepID=A0A0C4DPU4_MAGP6|nr:hypothetical protein MAPG_01872 [Magnaporthiopsis poae ATCC 64411]
MSARSFLLASVASLIASAAAHPGHAVLARQETSASIPTVHIPLGFKLKITTTLSLPWDDNRSIELVFDSGSENFWVFGPNSTTNWGCTSLLCPGPCNASVTSFYDWPKSPSASRPPQKFSSFYAYGAYTKYVTGNIAVNDTFTFTSTDGQTSSSTVKNVRVAVENYMSQRLGVGREGCAAGAGSYDLGILGVSPFYRKSDWNTTGPHVRQELLEQGAIKAPVQSIWFDEPPARWDGSFTGSAVFGGIDKSKFSGPLVKVPVLENDGLGASVGYFVAQPNVSVGGVVLPRGKLITGVCHLDTGTTSDDLPVQTEDFVKAMNLTRNEFGNMAWPGDCDTIPLDKTFELTFPAVPGQAHDSVTVKVPLRHYARPGGYQTPGSCALRIDTGGCMLSAPFAAASYFAADDAANEIALAQGGVSKRGSGPDAAAMSLTIA